MRQVADNKKNIKKVFFVRESKRAIFFDLNLLKKEFLKGKMKGKKVHYIVSKRRFLQKSQDIVHDKIIPHKKHPGAFAKG